MPKKVKTKEDVDACKRILNSFSNNLEGLREFISNLEPVVTKYDEKTLKKISLATKKLARVIGKEGEIKGKKQKEIIIKFPEKMTKDIIERKIEQITNILGELPKRPVAQAQLLYKSSFVMLVSYFDFLISDIIHFYYKLHPEGLSGKDLSITLNELKICSDHEEAIDVILNKKVDSILYGNLESQKIYFKNELQIDLREKIINWDIISEAVERRNIIVHNDSVVNRRYLRNVVLSVINKKRKDIKEGEKIGVDQEYFKMVYDEIFIAGIVLMQSCWRKWKKEDVEDADESLLAAIYEVLIREEWSVAERLGLFCKDIKVTNAAMRLTLDINYCQSLKWQNKKDELTAEMGKFDVSSLSPKFMLALCALQSDKDGFYKNLERAVIAEEMPQICFDDWPLFREMRQDVEYNERVNKAFIKKN